MLKDFQRKSGLNQVTISKLTERQIDILELVAKAYSNEEIAETLMITKDTVKTHLKSIYRRFDFSYCSNNASVNRLRVALLWLEYKNRIIKLKSNEIIEC